MNKKRFLMTTSEGGSEPNLKANELLRSEDFTKWLNNKNLISNKPSYPINEELTKEYRQAIAREKKNRTGGGNAWKRAAFYWRAKDDQKTDKLRRAWEGRAVTMALAAIDQGQGGNLPADLRTLAEIRRKELEHRETMSQSGTLARVSHYKAGKLWRRREWRHDFKAAWAEYLDRQAKAQAAREEEAATYETLSRESMEAEAWERIAARHAIRAAITWKRRKYKETIKLSAWAGMEYLRAGGRRDLPPQTAEEIAKIYKKARRIKD